MFELLVSLLIAAATPYSPVATLSAAPDRDEEVERAARDFRIQVYDTFHRDRSQYDSRSEAGDRVLSGYLQSGRRPEHREILKDWFVEARNASSPGQSSPLPHLPDFAAEPPTAGLAADNSPAVGQQAFSAVAVPSSTSATSDKGWSIETSVAGKVGGAILRAAMKTPGIAAAEPHPEPPIDIALSSVGNGESSTVETSEPLVAETQDALPVLPEKPSATVSLPAEVPATSEPTLDPTRGRPENEEAANPTVAVDAPAQPSGGPIQAVTDHNVPAQPSAALQRLSARITSFNGSLDYLLEETKEESPAKLLDIARLLNDLVDLAKQRREIAAQLETVPQAYREALPHLLPIEPAIAGLQATIDKTRSELGAGEFFRSDEERQRALALLNVLENQVEALAAGE